MSSLIDYTCASTAVANPDGSFATTVGGATVVAGPGDTTAGHFDSALALTAGGGATVDVSTLSPDLTRFTAQVVFALDAVPTTPQTLLACTAVPFSLTVERGSGVADASVVARATPTAGARAGASTAYAVSLQPGTWYTATLVYDTDTVAVFIDDALASVHALPTGPLAAGATKQLHLGHDATGGTSYVGRLASVRWQDDIPAALEAALDAARSGAEWFVSHKYETLPAGLAMGDPRSALAYVAGVGAYVQHFQNGLLMYADGAGVAFEMHGDIYATYSSLVDASPLGYLVSDEMDTRRPGGRKSLFSEGGIYWSPATGSVPVEGHLYLDYEGMGESSSVLGLPTAIADHVPGGLEQVFEGGRMYLKDGASVAHEVHGDILGHYLATGGPGTWGFPLTNESDVLDSSTSVGRFNEFEACTIYWSPGTGAHEVHGDIREKYRNLRGPIGELGFPTSDEGDIPGAAAPARYNTFQNGSLLWFGSYSGMVTALPFQVYLGRIDTVESEGFLMGQNDLYFRLTLKDGGSTLFDQRFPSSGDYGNNNSRDADITIPVTVTPNRADMEIVLVVDVWDSDDGAPFGGGDDHLGCWTRSLTMANGWGLLENGGILHSGGFSNINDISASVKPVVDPATLTDGDKWWGVQNRGTQVVTYQEYGDAFADVDDQPETFDPTDWLEEAFYELVVKGLAANGNCFGMSLEGINARKGVSLYSLPLSRFTSWEQVRTEFNIKHLYQVGSGPVWWFVGEFLSGRTHDPVDVFNATEDCFARGDNPVLCLSQHADFSGAPHCVMPIGWDRSGPEWTMTICDPNFPATTRTLTVNPTANTFHYDGGNVYDGSSTSGGRLHYMPYRLLCSPPNTPIWDAIALILAGTVIILGSDSRTESITNSGGADLDAFGDRARQIAAGKRSIDDCFFSLQGVASPMGLGPAVNGVLERPVGDIAKIDPAVLGNVGRIIDIPAKPDSPMVGEVLMRRGRSIQDVVLQRRPTFPVSVHTPVGSLVNLQRGLAPVAADMVADVELGNQIAPMTVHQVAANKELMGSLSEAAQVAINGTIAALLSDEFTHTVRGADNGRFDYTIKQGLTEIHVGSAITAAEQMSVRVSGLATSKSVVEVTSPVAKTIDLRVHHKLGVGPDHLGITVSGIPIAPDASVVVNPKPGLGGLEIVAGGTTQVDLAVTVDTVLGGRPVTQRFTVPMQGGARINPAPVVDQGALQVAQIDAVFGPALSKAVIAALQ
ncbi:hypothetical protein GCM10028801_19730 [Nocardioides maradonensis]